jgi:U32 family peptidase
MVPSNAVSKPSIDRSKAPSKPEILAPAGDLDALKAALSEGADAVYFGLRDGFNARARAGNFSIEELPETVARIRRAGARAYLALNTLVFEPELSYVERVVRAAVDAGIDALIVQDPAVCVIARLVDPTIELHASTQMTISSAESAVFAESLGCSRVVLPRELSVDEIRRFLERSSIETEVFIHGALCVSWSGQCLTSEAWGGRSANRGECAQSCRMPYDLVVDGSVRPLGDVAYLLSPKDLAGARAVADLAALGVRGLKIEGRQKNAHYVATAAGLYRRLVDGLSEGSREAAEARAREDLLDASLAYTRGFSDGFLAGSDHQTLVEGRFPKHRGVFLGRVVAVRGRRVDVAFDPSGRPWTGALAADGARSSAKGTPSSALSGFGGPDDAAGGPTIAPFSPRPGMGVVFDDGRPEDKDEPGGPLFAVDARDDGYTLVFGDPGPDLRRVKVGARAWATGDPSAQRATAKKIEGSEPKGRIAATLHLDGRLGEPLRVGLSFRGARVDAASKSPLAAATGRGLSEELLFEKLAAFGGTPFRATEIFGAAAVSGFALPVSELKDLRRRLVAEAERLLLRVERRAPDGVSAVARAYAAAPNTEPRPEAPPAAPRLVPLVRNEAQLKAALDFGLPEVELDWMEMTGLSRAVAIAREASRRAIVATTRVQKPGEEAYDARIEALRPDGVLVRHFGALVHFHALKAGRRPELHGDFSLNVANSITARELLRRGLRTFTASHDLDETQLFAMLERTPAEATTVVLHHRVATFHTEHCVYAHLLSEGRDYRTCGRPCENRDVALRDHKGRSHPVLVDVACRNTVFDGEKRTSAAIVPELLRRGVRRFRVEFTREDALETTTVLRAYAALLKGEATPNEAAAAADARATTGVSDSPMKILV